MRDGYFEDWTVGERLETGSLVVTRESVLAFARDYDPQPFHLDDAAAAASMFGKLAASGWQTASIAMRLLVDAGVFTGRGGVGLGVDDLRWSRPVYPGDALRVVAEIVDKRSSSGDKPTGIVRFKNTTYNQDDVVVMTHVAIALVPKRPASS